MKTIALISVLTQFVLGISASNIAEETNLVGYRDANPFRLCFDGLHRFFSHGSRWEHRCMKCRCDFKKGLMCEVPKCHIPYQPYHRNTCVRWSEDGCCCEELGCKVGRDVYKIGQSYPYPPGDPCGSCRCELDSDHTNCSRKLCPKPVCVDAVLIKGECCVRCMKGPNCQIPSLPGVHFSFFNRALRIPLLLSKSTLIQSDENPLIFYKCICKVPGELAECEEKPFNSFSPLFRRTGR